MNILYVTGYVIQLIFLLILLSYYFLLIIKKRIKAERAQFKTLSVIIPAHNEEPYLAESIRSVIKARFNGKKEIIVIDDGSRDRTAEIASGFPVRLIRTKHRGKANSLNLGIKESKGELIAVVDGDSVIGENSLNRAAYYLRAKNTAAVCGVVKVKNNHKFLGMWLHMEQLYNSLIRRIFSNINANITTPGPLSVYRKEDLERVGGFETKSYLEDVDVAVKLVRSGRRIIVADDVIAYTYMPITLKGFVKQRTRFARGWLNILRRHLRLNNTIIDIYTLPLALFWYLQAAIMGLILSYQIFSGYSKYFLAKGVLFNWLVARYFFEWLSIFGTLRWIKSILIGATPLTLIALTGLAATLMSYPLYIIAIIKYDKRINLVHLVTLTFMFPYWFLIMVIYLLNIGYWFDRSQRNIWEKYK